MFSFTRLARLGLAAAFATTLAAGVAKAETLVMAIANTPASLDGDQALSAEGEMMMANIHGGDLFLYSGLDHRTARQISGLDRWSRTSVGI